MAERRYCCPHAPIRQHKPLVRSIRPLTPLCQSRDQVHQPRWSAEGEENPPSSEVPELDSQLRQSPLVALRSKQTLKKEATELSESESHAETIVSASCETAGKNRRAKRPQRVLPQTRRAESRSRGREQEAQAEQKSGTTDEVIELDNSNEAIPDTISAPTTQPPGGSPTQGSYQPKSSRGEAACCHFSG